MSQDAVPNDVRLSPVDEEQVSNQEEVIGTEDGNERVEEREEIVEERIEGEVAEARRIEDREEGVEVREDVGEVRIAPETDARRLVDDVGEGGSRMRGKKREYEEELENVRWDFKRRKPDMEWIEAVFNNHQLIQPRYMRMMSRMIAEEDREEFEGLVEQLKDSWEDAEEKIKRGE